ncbi:phosphoserine phosphatase [Rhizobium ruizarguesonis]|uniref:Phosphoserine phosphatase n=1 Tax=Rhizobium ruizarguesonis TaxID=2081791 RepID=A0ABY1WVW9_9HYPH|nr:MtnX-like HAD-IB family phosphatase [Rhizobium ruizarguesonis]TAU13041.1 phosphoserine phosphatase [Rhizobium ruizarguesonis]TAU58934.1 phosphoserine phosphatase [Rhizobium ruizarguesonis]TAV01796.1 phosphoserine phosphatase [Rhizobium ruizarguesonis]TAV18862.1 phosphoserine phosphatase [Rhizobium ruizarguesonis]TAV25766.1 phosphoserine phosphatase [Rhizobium ruizarguesonis]
MQVFSDFDGTISIQDVTDIVLSHFADPEWEEIEKQWKDGLIGSADCMRRQIALIRASRGELGALLDTVAIDPGFKSFLDYCRLAGLPVSVVSDGVDHFIRHVLLRNGIADLPVIANRLTYRLVDGREAYALSPALTAAGCSSGSGVCKCHVIWGIEPHIYIGDGRSDFCVAGMADIVFAKDRLADHCTDHGIPFIGFADFTDLRSKLKAVLPGIARQGRAVPQSQIA